MTLSLGAMTPGPAQLYGTGTEISQTVPYGLAAADVDHDGNVDLWR